MSGELSKELSHILSERSEHSEFTASVISLSCLDASASKSFRYSDILSSQSVRTIEREGSSPVIRRELEILCRDHQFDILGLNETRVDEHTKDSEIQIDGYDIYSDDRNTSGGGVAVYVNKNVRHFHRSDIKDPKLEIVGVEITPLHAKNFIVL